MNFFTIFAFILLITVGTALGALGKWTVFSTGDAPADEASVSDRATPLVLSDLPPPDDTYTPDQRRFS